MPANANRWNALAATLRNLSQMFPAQSDPVGEADLYYRRAHLAACEQRYDVALVFCGKAIGVEPSHLPSRLLLARIHDRGLGNLEAAVAGYKKVIALAGYDGANPYCAAARQALDELVQKTASHVPGSRSEVNSETQT